MLRQILVLMAISALATLSFGQIVVHSTDLPSLGASTSWGSLQSATFNIGHAGVNQIWTFGDYSFSHRWVDDVVLPQTGPSAELFPRSNRAVNSHIPGSTTNYNYDYQRVDTTGVFCLGDEYPGTVDVYAAELLELPLPLQYLSTWTTLQYDTMELDPLVYVLDSCVYRVDGWGQIQTPFGSYPCLRVFKRLYGKFYVDGTLSIQQEVSCLWYNQAGEQIVRCIATDGETGTNFTTGSLRMRDVPLAAAPISPLVATNLALGQNYPNPFNASTEIRFQLAATSPVELTVYNALGEHVAALIQGTVSSGTHAVQWNGLTAAGTPAPTGTYIYQLKAGNSVDSKKMILLK